MEPRLHGRVALVTGASAGSGRAIAQRLASDGAHVYVCARDPVGLAEVVGAIERSGGSASAIAADVCEPSALERMTATVADGGLGLDIFVSNVGGPDPFGSWDELDDAAWRRTFEYNVFSVVRLTRGLLPFVRKSRAGRIVLVGSISALEPNRYNPHYAAAKAALHNFGKYLAAELAPAQITVNIIAPATLDSRSRERNIERRSALEGVPLADVRARTEAGERAKIPLGRIGTPADIAGVAAFFASDEAAWITGSTLLIDGGSSKSAW
jgi:3-oxoacyl-[acyl-carrier protein] reductase